MRASVAGSRVPFSMMNAQRTNIVIQSNGLLKPRSFKLYLAIPLYTCLILFLFRHIVFGGYTFLIYSDAVDQSFCWLNKIFIAVQNGELPLWDFSTQCGTSFIGELQTSALYPVALIAGKFATIGDPKFVDFFLLFHFLIASVGMHICLTSFGFSFLESVFGAVVFAFCSAFSTRVYAQPNLFASLAYMPLSVALLKISLDLEKATEKGIFAGLSGIATGFVILAGHIYPFIFTIIAQGLLIFCFTKNGKVRVNIISFVFTISVALIIVSPQLLASREYFRLAYKWYGSGYTKSPHIVPYEEYIKIRVFFSDLSTLWTGSKLECIDGGTLYVSRIALLLSVFELLQLTIGLRHVNKSIFVYALCIIVVSLAIASLSDRSIGYAFYMLPVINVVRAPSRFVFLYAFGMSIMATLGLATLLTYMRHALAKLGTFGFAQTVMICFCLIILILEANSFTKEIGLPRANPLSADSVIVKPGMAAKLLEIQNGNSLMYRFAAIDNKSIPPNISNILPFLATQGYRSSRLCSFHDFFDFNPHSKSMDLLGVRWWLTDKDIDDLKLVFKYDNINIYQRDSALKIFWQPGKDGQDVDLPISQMKMTTNSIRVHFGKDVSGTVVFAQPYYPGWRAYANGTRQRLKKFGILTAVELEKPSESLELVYSPSYLFISIVISLVVGSMISLAFIWLIAYNWYVKFAPRFGTR
jgi:hypothetical protein